MVEAQINNKKVCSPHMIFFSQSGYKIDCYWFSNNRMEVTVYL